MTQQEIKENVAFNLKELRRKNKLTQTDLSFKIGVSQKNVGSWEEKRALPPLELMYAITELFNVKIDSFITQRLT